MARDLGQDWGISIFNDGIVRLVIGHSLFSIAVVSYLVRARLVGLDAQLEEASADLYAPRCARSSGSRSPRDARRARGLPAVVHAEPRQHGHRRLRLGVGHHPWPVYVLSALRSGLRPEIAAVSTIMLVLTLLALGAVALVLKRAGDSATDIARTMAGG